MNDTNSWKPGGGSSGQSFISSGGKSQNGGQNNVQNNNGNGGSMKKKPNKLLVGLGAGGGVLLLISGIIALLGFFFVVRPAYALLSSTNKLKNNIDTINESIVNRDLVTLRAELDETQQNLADLRNARDEKFQWASNLPVAKDYYADSDHFINAGELAVEAAREMTVIIEPFADAVGLRISEDVEIVEQEGLMEAFQSWVSVMPEVSDQLDPVIEKIALIGEEMEYVDASRYPKDLNGIPLRGTIELAQKSLAQANEFAPDIKLILAEIPEALGVGTGEKRYGIIMQNDKEIRATGGFWTNYATFKLQNALLASDFTSKDMYSIDFVLEPIDPYTDFPDVPLAYGKYLKVERMFARDANISPDYPTAIDQFMYFYNLANQQAPWEVKPVEGFIAIDTTVVKELLEITGPVTVNGITYDENNVVLELEKLVSLSLAEQANRKRVLGDLMEGMLINVFESDSDIWPKLIDKGFDLLARKHIQVFLFDEEKQALVEKYNIGGAIVSSEVASEDYVFPVMTNLGGDKTNLFVTKNVDHAIAKEGDRWVRTTTLKYTYNDLGPDYAALVKTYRDWIRLYVPLGSELISVEGSDDNDLGSGEEKGRAWFSGHITLNPGETAEVTFKYYLPDGLVKDDNYSLYIQKQAGTDAEIHSVVVNGQSQEVELSTDKTLEFAL